jgi:hypothetical protein
MADTLPPLPEPDVTAYITDSAMRSLQVRAHSDRQLEAYARAALAAVQPVQQPADERITGACLSIDQACDLMLEVISKPREPGWSYRNTITTNRQVIRELTADIRQLAAAQKPVQQPGTEPDMRHPKIQALIGSRARCQIELLLVEQLIEDPDCDLTSMDMEYWGSMHDRLKKALTKAAPAQRQPLSEAQK